MRGMFPILHVPYIIHQGAPKAVATPKMRPKAQCKCLQK